MILREGEEEKNVWEEHVFTIHTLWKKKYPAHRNLDFYFANLKLLKHLLYGTKHQSNRLFQI